jgi:hypothetical protein
MHTCSRLANGGLAPAIIARRRRRGRVPEQRLHRRKVHTRVEQVARERDHTQAAPLMHGGDLVVIAHQSAFRR